MHFSSFLEEMCIRARPKTREEFENRAVLYHILMDLEEFLIFKKRFIDMLNEEHFRVYWQQDMEKGKQHEKGR